MTNWQLFPTETRRFTHTTEFQLHYNAKADSWAAYVAYDRTEVWPGSSHRQYKDLTKKQVARLFALAAQNGMICDFVHGYGMNSKQAILIWIYKKPMPVCHVHGCNRRISVPDYRYQPRYCVNHRDSKD